MPHAACDAGPEIVRARSLVGGYDGPGPLIDLVLAAVVLTARWRFVPLVAAAVSALYLAGGFANADFVDRLTSPGGAAFVGGWLQMLGFAAAVACGIRATTRPRGRAMTTSRGKR